ncbi:MAG: hypothetical protein KatS3mg085_051 [Candidatus Dojkabacteria bacterium]|nr:MAG: hypothetical protein KatS3mg085_051 [Candidatus Dojkabacteria bacterium]
MKILVTGVAGFIGHHLVLQLLNQDHEVIGVDAIDDYYDVSLKHERLKLQGIDDFESNLVKSNKFVITNF